MKIKTILLEMFVFLLVFGMTLLGCQPPEDEDITKYNGHTYEVIDIEMSWTEAQRYCERNDGYLVTITSAGEQAFIENLIKEKGNKNVYWLGGYRNSEGNFRWITGESFQYTNWAFGEPNNNGGIEDKVQLVASEGLWNDGENVYNPSDNTFWSVIGFVCEYGGTVAPSVPTGLQAQADLLEETSSTYNVNVQWNSVPRATSYEVYFANNPDLEWYDLDGRTTATSYTSNGNYTSYHSPIRVKVKAVNSAGSSDFSAYTEVIIPNVLQAPTGLQVNLIYSKEANSVKYYNVSLSWNSVSGATGYNIYYTSSNAYYNVYDGETNTTSYILDVDFCSYDNPVIIEVKSYNLTGESDSAYVEVSIPD